MWGTLDPVILGDFLDRFIPTHVGNSDNPMQELVLVSVHPHACGELKFLDNAVVVGYGSSPRMWGTQHKDRNKIDSARFIPTHVGNSIISENFVIPAPVHPHACGELGQCLPED